MPQLLHAGVLSPFSVQDMAGESAPRLARFSCMDFSRLEAPSMPLRLPKKNRCLVPFTVNRAETYGEFFIPTLFSGLDDCGVVKCFCVWA